MITDQSRHHKVLLPINHNHYSFQENKSIPFFVKELLIPTFPTKCSANSSILENPQFGRVSGCCYGYCDKLCDWWIKLSALNMIG